MPTGVTQNSELHECKHLRCLDNAALQLTLACIYLTLFPLYNSYVRKYVRTSYVRNVLWHSTLLHCLGTSKPRAALWSQEDYESASERFFWTMSIQTGGPRSMTAPSTTIGDYGSIRIPIGPHWWTGDVHGRCGPSRTEDVSRRKLSGIHL